MKGQSSASQRYEWYQRHQAGESYARIAQDSGLSKECVRYWCRRQRDGGSCRSRYQRHGPGPLSRCEAMVRYVILRLKLSHMRWGRNRLRYHLGKRRSVQGLTLPSENAIGRYLHQWARFHRAKRRDHQPVERNRPDQPRQVHQRWQIDFKTDLSLDNGLAILLHTVRDPVGEVCLGAVIFASARGPQRGQRVKLEQVRAVLRRCFGQWHTLPDQIQTDGEPILVANGLDAFPSLFTLWLAGLGIEHRVIRSGYPTDNAEVERCHRTITDYAIIGNEGQSLTGLQACLDQAVWELAYELPSQAQGCQGRPPVVAHPELLHPRRPFQPQHELAHFDLKRVDAFLGRFTWSRRVSQTGQICLGGAHHYYAVGRAWASQVILIRFDPVDRHFVFYPPDQPDRTIGRRPARHLDVVDLTGLAPWPDELVPQQLPLPFLEGVTF